MLQIGIYAAPAGALASLPPDSCGTPEEDAYPRAGSPSGPSSTHKR
jgi:hypothetical protein